MFTIYSKIIKHKTPKLSPLWS